MNPSIIGGINTSPSMGGTSKGWTISESANVNFLKELHRLEKQAVIYREKIENERLVKEKLDEEFVQARKEFNRRQTATRNGFAVKEDDKEYRKIIARLESQLESTNVKLSTESKNNRVMKKKIEDLRKTKLMNLKISADLSAELDAAKMITDKANREVASINDKRYKIKNEIANAKHQMVLDFEQFTDEVYKAKSVIDLSQEQIKTSIKERIQVATSMTFTQSNLNDKSLSTHGRATTSNLMNIKEIKSKLAKNEIEMNNPDVDKIIAETGAQSIDTFLSSMESFESEIFDLYQDIVDKYREKEQLENDIKSLNEFIKAIEEKISSIRSYKDLKRQELESNIAQLHLTIEKLQEEYDSRQKLLREVSDDLMHLLKNIAMNDEALDTQLLSTGIYDRNMNDFLGLVELRIDNLIQMAKAVNNVSILREDFVQIESDNLFDGGALQESPRLDMADVGISYQTEGEDDATEGILVPVNVHSFRKNIEKRFEGML